MNCARKSGKTGFTLLELAVVLGILAVAVGVIVPAVRHAREVSAGISCEVNLHTLFTACTQYNMDYKGRYPFGFVWNKQNSKGRPTDNGASGYIAWFSSLDKYLTPGTNEITPYDENLSPFFDGSTPRVFHSAFKCPAVPANFQQMVHYYQNGVAMPLMTLELGLTPSGRAKLTAPARTDGVYQNTALLWDTQVWAEANEHTPSMFWGTDHTATGFAPFCTYIDDNGFGDVVDNGLLDHPEYPERRFRGPEGDRFAISTNALKNPDGPIAFPTDRYMQEISNGQFTTLNQDMGGNFVYDPGYARFRHPNQGCNVLFADGSVRTLFLHPGTKVSYRPTGRANFIDSDFRRNMLMIKWPGGGIVDSNTYPTD